MSITYHPGREFRLRVLCKQETTISFEPESSLPPDSWYRSPSVRLSHRVSVSGPHPYPPVFPFAPLSCLLVSMTRGRDTIFNSSGERRVIRIMNPF